MHNPSNVMHSGHVAVVYDGFPHYRKGIIEELASSERFQYYFFGDSKYRATSIKTYDFPPQINFVRTTGMSLGPIFLQRGLCPALMKTDVTHCILLGNPWFLSYWWLTIILRLLGKRVLFWSHGWLSRDEPVLKRAFRDLFFCLPNGLLLYGRRSREIGIARGFAADRLYVVSNSLDYAHQKAIYAGLQTVARAELRQEFGLPTYAKIIICSARLTALCRFDLLIFAASALLGNGLDLFVVLVGDGPERHSLSTLATSKAVPHLFLGECYDETTLARLYKASDLTVSPGKVGLTAIHSMAYGTPVISHGNLDHQMPEVEAIIPGVTGDLFIEGSAEDLARTIGRWFELHPRKPESDCINRVESEFTPQFQRRVIERALSGEAPNP